MRVLSQIPQITIDNLLREYDRGYYGQSHEDVMAWNAARKAHGACQFRYPNGESLEDVYARASAWVALFRTYLDVGYLGDDESVVVVCHCVSVGLWFCFPLLRFTRIHVRGHSLCSANSVRMNTGAPIVVCRVSCASAHTNFQLLFSNLPVTSTPTMYTSSIVSSRQGRPVDDEHRHSSLLFFSCPAKPPFDRRD